MSTSTQSKCVRCGHPLGGSQCRKCLQYNLDFGLPLIDGKDGTVTLDKVRSAEESRLNTGIFNACWSGFDNKGVVNTSVTLLGGIPGAGKTTMLLQLAGFFAEETGKETGLIAAEQADNELKLYADRLQLKNPDKIRLIPALTGTVNVAEVLNRYKFGAVIIDSLQGLFGDESEPCISLLKQAKQYAVEKKAPVMIVSHVTKEGDYAGLMKLQHDVDTLFLFEVDEETGLRELRVLKNRFGKAHVSTFLEMTETGLIAAKLPEENEDDYDN